MRTGGGRTQTAAAGFPSFRYWKRKATRIPSRDRKGTPMFATSLAPWFTRQNIHYGWAMVALTFLTAACAAAALSMPGVLLLPISREFGWTRGGVSGAIALMLVMFGAMAPFSGALLQRFGLRRVVTVALLLAAAALIGTTQVTQRWHLWLSIGIVLGLA